MAATRSLALSLLLSFTVLFLALVPVQAVQPDLAGISYNPGPFGLQRRQSSGCSEDTPCAGGECCNGKTGFCGIDADHCDPDVCVSNCDAKAECGQYADPAGKMCPLNVCCGEWGYCGMTEDFCNDKCQSNCDQPGATKLSNGNVTSLVIGYVEAWNLQLDPNVGCAYRSFDWIPIDSVSHINVAFGYIQPSSFTIAPMPDVHIETFKNLTALKQKAPGLQIWLSLGGWTFSDNGTDTQPVWGDVARTASSRTKFAGNLVSFLTEWGFDGVDLDWEYPGAPDRGGKTEDTQNFVDLVKTLRDTFDSQVSSKALGLSFTAPTSYWYMRWFDIGNMTQYVDWMNLMTYDLHGSWDSPADQIGSLVYAHTNMTEITSALDLLWRNDVPANKVNLGVGFYGRSYTLEDPSCRTAGCPFSAPGKKGPCTKTEGILSYQELTSIRDTKKVSVKTDEDAQIVYFTYDNDQWVSYDDHDTLLAKQKYANEKGLLGLFIWALDQDDQYHTALNALTGGLGKFAAQNGVGSYETWSGATSSCYISDCAEHPTCSKTGTSRVGNNLKCSNKRYQLVCCPLDSMPDSTTCEWNEGKTAILHGDSCNSAKCPDGTLEVADNKDYVIDGDYATCLDSGTAKFCCETEITGKDVCDFEPSRCALRSDIEGGAAVCANGRRVAGYSAGNCATDNDMWSPWCCSDDADTSGCYWAPGDNEDDDPKDCSNVLECRNDEVLLGTDYLGGGIANCQYRGPQTCIVNAMNPICSQDPHVYTTPRAFCCPAGALNVKISTVPVPLANLFPQNPPDTNENDWEVDIDHIDGGGSSGDDFDDADTNAFGWHIISGPDDATTSLDRRDGSHWALVGCDSDSHLRRRTVQAVCTNQTEHSNCGDIFKGGVATTVVKMPRGCGAGKYAVAVSMERASSVSKEAKKLVKRLAQRLAKRGGGAAVREEDAVYDFTFDYDWEPVTKRSDASDLLLRIDYSDDPGYWGTVVSLASTDTIGKREDVETKKRELQEEVDREHGGNWRRYMEHRFHQERRSTPPDQLHALHARWFSNDLANWLRALRYVDNKYEAVRHSINRQYQWYLFDYVSQCEVYGIPQDSYLRVWTDLDINVEVSGELTLIGDMGHLDSFFEQSSVLFRTNGGITSSLNVEAFAELSFSSNRIELFGLDTFGATFSVPGLVTIGPNMRIFGQLDGRATLHSEATVSMDLAHWDYTQQYPNRDDATQDAPTKDQGIVDQARKDAPEGSGALDSKPQFHADVSADGYLKATISPVLTFGITWALGSVPDTSIDFGMDVYGTVQGRATASADNTGGGAGAEACYSIIAGYQAYAAVNAPTIFKHPLSQTWILSGPYANQLVPETCYEYIAWNGTNYCEDCPAYPDKTDDNPP